MALNNFNVHNSALVFGYNVDERRKIFGGGEKAMGSEGLGRDE